MSIKNNILSLAKKLKPQEMNITDVGTVYIKQMTAGEREALEEVLGKQKDKHTIRATVFAHSVCDENGELLFGADEIETINTLPSKLVMQVFTTSNQINGFDNEENIEKN